MEELREACVRRHSGKKPRLDVDIKIEARKKCRHFFFYSFVMMFKVFILFFHSLSSLAA
jgi:hypothetical protein